MALSNPLRIDQDLVDSATLTGQTLSRSTPQQIAHWARMGRALEENGLISQGTVSAVLDGRLGYDDAPGAVQAAVRVEWEDRVDAARADIDLPGEFEDEGRSWSTVDEDGNLVRWAGAGR